MNNKTILNGVIAVLNTSCDIVICTPQPSVVNDHIAVVDGEEGAS